MTIDWFWLVVAATGGGCVGILAMAILRINPPENGWTMERLTIRPGDCIVLSTDRQLSPEAIKQLRATLEPIAEKSGAKIVVLADRGMKLTAGRASAEGR